MKIADLKGLASKDSLAAPSERVHTRFFAIGHLLMARGTRPASKKKRAAPAKPEAPPIAKTKPDICFVIMPFGGRLDSYYTSIYSPAIEAAGLEPRRADDLFRPSTIVNDIWAYTKKAKVLLADLTGKNPNVFYELGLAHALGKPAILVAESMEDIPFDLRALRIILYDKNAPSWGDVLRQKITNSLQEVLEAPAEAVLPAFLDVKTSTKPTVSPEQKELISIKQELELVRRELRTQRAEEPQSPLRPTAARARIDRYLGLGVSDEEILTHLVSQGVPPGWARGAIKEQRSNLESELPPRASVKKEPTSS